jgi:hypothetical protein
MLVILIALIGSTFFARFSSLPRVALVFLAMFFLPSWS